MFRSSLRAFLRDERGNVESALVMIPLLSLFLIATQVSVAIHARNMAKMSIQSQASERAISADFRDSDTFQHIYSPDENQNLDLIITHKKRDLPALIPGLSTILSGGSQIDVSGIAIVENQR